MEILSLSPSPHSPHLEIPNTSIVHHLHSFVHESRGVIITISLVEDSESHLVLRRVDEIVDAKHIQKVHLIPGIQGAVEVMFGELNISPAGKGHILAVTREVIDIVQRSHALRDVVHSHTVVLQIHNHSNRLSKSELFYTFTQRSNTYH